MQIKLVVSGILSDIFAQQEPKIKELIFTPVVSDPAEEKDAPPFAQLILREVDSRHAPKLGDTMILDLNPPQPELVPDASLTPA